MKRIIQSILKSSKKVIEFCGKHPFATGLLAILGIIGFIISVKGYRVDRQEAESTTQQVESVSNQIKTLDEKIGESYNNGQFLYEEKVELYWNDWWGHPLSSRKEIEKYHQAEITIRGEGKTVDFSGVLSMNCMNGKHYWVTASNFSSQIASDEEIERLVPKEVISNVYKLYCREK